MSAPLSWEHAFPVWTGTSYIVLYQASWAHCVSSSGAIPQDTSQWIVKMIHFQVEKQRGVALNLGFWTFFNVNVE